MREIRNHRIVSGWYSTGKPQLPFVLSDSGSHLVLGGEGGSVVWDIHAKIAVFASRYPLTISPSGRLIATWEPGEIVVAELPSGRRIAGYAVRGSAVPSLVHQLFGCELLFSPNERYLAFSRRDEDSEFVIIDQQDQTIRPLVQSRTNVVSAGFFYEAPILRCAWHPASDYLAVSTGFGVQVYGVDGNLKTEFASPASDVAYSGDGKALLSHNLTDLFIVTGFDAETLVGAPLRKMDSLRGCASDAWLRTLDFGQKSPRLLDFVSETSFHSVPLAEFWKHPEEPIVLSPLQNAFSPDGEVLAWLTEVKGAIVRNDLSFQTNSRPVTLHLTDLQRQSEFAQLTIDSRDYLWFDATSQHLLLQTHHGLRRWPLQSTERQKQLGQPVSLSALKPAGHIQSAGGSVAMVFKQDKPEAPQTYVVNLLTGSEIAVTNGMFASLSCLSSLSYDGAWFVGYGRKRFELRRTQDPSQVLVRSWPIKALRGPGSLTPQFSRDSRWLGFVVEDGLLLYDTKTSREEHILFPGDLRDAEIAGLTFSPDARELMLAFIPGDLVLVSVPQATIVARFRLPAPFLKYPCALAYDANGERISLVSERILATWDRRVSLATLTELGIAW